MMKTDQGLESLRRPITAEERELIEWLLEHRESDSSEFSSQVERLEVISKCKCGCPTIYFSVKENPPSSEILLADYYATVDGHPVGVMLFQRGGYLSSLEVYSCDGLAQQFGLPSIDTLRPLENP
jgi:hypothetical protein